MKRLTGTVLLLKKAAIALVLSMPGGCTSEPQPAADILQPAVRDTPQPESSASVRDEAPREPLDLSLPDNFFADEKLPNTEPLPPKFDAGELFTKEKESATSIMVLPQAEDGGLPRGISDIEGATVTIKTKTR